MGVLGPDHRAAFVTFRTIAGLSCANVGVAQQAALRLSTALAQKQRVRTEAVRVLGLHWESATRANEGLTLSFRLSRVAYPCVEGVGCIEGVSERDQTHNRRHDRVQSYRIVIVLSVGVGLITDASLGGKRANSLADFVLKPSYGR